MVCSIACVRSSHSIGDAPSHGVRCPQGRSYPGEIGWKVCLVTNPHGPFEQGERPVQVALAQGQQTDPPRGLHQAPGVSNRLCNLEPFFPEGPALSERAQLGMAPGEEGTGKHGRQVRKAETLVAPRPIDEHRGLPEVVDCPTIVVLEKVGLAEA